MVGRLDLWTFPIALVLDLDLFAIDRGGRSYVLTVLGPLLVAIVVVMRMMMVRDLGTLSVTLVFDGDGVPIDRDCVF